LEPIELQLLLPNHLQESINVCFLLCLEFLVKFTQAGSSVMVRIGGGRRARQKLRAGRAQKLVRSHLAWGGNRRVVKLKVHEDGSSAAGLWRGSVAGHRTTGRTS
jgi:hypothetical protein